jgi:serine/threonine protein kinase
MKPLASSDPTVVASYRLLGVLGGGGMGRVYLGQSRSGRLLAIKVVRPELAEDPEFRRRFAREVVAVRAVSPLFTAPVVDADTEAEAPWLATTYIDGPSLDQHVSEHGPMALGPVLILAAGLAEALASIHRVGLVHRDVKPKNVLMDHRGAHIIDFGIALASDATQVTASLLMGTPSYMAPERLQGGAGSPPGDVFALGATLYFAATGKELVNGATTYIKILQVMEGHFNLSAVPKELGPVVVRCTSRRPKDRPTAEELARIFAASGVSAPEPDWYKVTAATTPPVVLEPLPRSGRSRRTLLTALGVLGAAVAGGGASAFAGLFDATAEDLHTTPDATAAGPSQPSRVLWYGRSGSPPPIVVARGSRIIATRGSDVTAVDERGSRLWTRTLPASPLRLHRWGDSVLVTGGSWLWLLDPAKGGEQRFAVNAGQTEASAGVTPGPVLIGGVALSTDVVFINVGAAMIAVDRSGRQVWRRQTPASPRTADGRWLVTQDVVGFVAHVGLHDAATGTPQWSRQYTLEPQREQPPPPSPDAPPPPPDDAWRLSEARIGQTHLFLRDAQEFRALRISNGGTAWQRASLRPVAAIELAGDVALVAADRLVAHSVTTGEPMWQAPLRGARLAVSDEGRTIIAATEVGVTALDAQGNARWHTTLPDPLAPPDRLTIDDRVAFVTFKARPGRPEALNIDVVAVALDA